MRLYERIKKEIRPALGKKYHLPELALPKIEKVIITVGIGPFKEKNESLEAIKKELTLISGQKPKMSRAKKSISGFKIRQGQLVGYVVTLRGKRMWGFIEKIVTIVLPRIRDFDGINPKSFDKSSNLTIGIKEQLAFPEIRADEIKENWGMSITFGLKNTANKDLVREYLEEIGFKFSDSKNSKDKE